MMKKQRIKLSLIDDYIKIVMIKNFFNNSFDDVKLGSTSSFLMQQTRNLDCQLEKIYKSLFQVLNMDDMSLAILNRDLQKNNTLFLSSQQCKFNNLDDILNNSKSQLNNILSNLKFKISQLKVDLPIANLCK